MASTYTVNLGIEIPAAGDYNNTWYVPADANYNLIDSFAGGTLSLSVSGGSTTLTKAQAVNQILSITGSLSSDQTIFYPAIGGGRKTVVMGATLNGHKLYIKGNGDTVGVWWEGAWAIPMSILVGSSRVYWAGYESAPVGAIEQYPIGVTIPGRVLADGRLLSTATYDLLYSLYGTTFGSGSGTFKVPDLRGVVLPGADNMGTGSRGILNGWAVNTFGGESAHLLATSELPAHTHGTPSHTHSVNDPKHSHTIPIASIGGGGNDAGNGNKGVSAGSTSTAATGITIGSTSFTTLAAGGGGTHNNVQPSQTTAIYIRF